METTDSPALFSAFWSTCVCYDSYTIIMIETTKVLSIYQDPSQQSRVRPFAFYTHGSSDHACTQAETCAKSRHDDFFPTASCILETSPTTLPLDMMKRPSMTASTIIFPSRIFLSLLSFPSSHFRFSSLGFFLSVFHCARRREREAMSPIVHKSSGNLSGFASVHRKRKAFIFGGVFAGHWGVLWRVIRSNLQVITNIVKLYNII